MRLGQASSSGLPLEPRGPTDSAGDELTWLPGASPAPTWLLKVSPPLFLTNFSTTNTSTKAMHS